MEKITADISSFETLRKDGFVYVDKTDLLWRLASRLRFPNEKAICHGRTGFR